MKIKTLLVALLAMSMVLLSGCSLTQSANTAGVAGETYMAIDQTDQMLAKYGKYSTSTEAIAELDNIKFDLKEMLMGEIDILSVEGYYYKSVAVYNTLYSEVVARKAELTPLQLAEFESLNRRLLALNESILAFHKTSEGMTTAEIANYLLRIVTASASAFKYYSILVV